MSTSVQCCPRGDSGSTRHFAQVGLRSLEVRLRYLVDPEAAE